MRSLLSLVVVVGAWFTTAQALALPAGLNGTRWRTTFTLPGNASDSCDLVINGEQVVTSYISGSWNSDGYLTIESSDAGKFKGHWFRQGSSGTYRFEVRYQNGYPVELQGFYDAPFTNGMQFPWNGIR